MALWYSCNPLWDGIVRCFQFCKWPACIEPQEICLSSRNICFMIWSHSSDSYYKPGDAMGWSLNTPPDSSSTVKDWGHYGTAAGTPWTVLFLNGKPCHCILCQVIRIKSGSKHSTYSLKRLSSPIRMKYWAPKSYSINENYCNCTMIYSCFRLECTRILMQLCSVSCFPQGLRTDDDTCEQSGVTA